MNLGLRFGMIGAWLLLLWSIFLGGNLASDGGFPCVVLVLGGALTLFVHCVSYSGIFKRSRAMIRSHCPGRASLEKLIDELVTCAAWVERGGTTGLERIVKEIKDPFLARGIRLAAERANPDVIESILTAELEQVSAQREPLKAALFALEKYAPVAGAIGMLVGVVAMLQGPDGLLKIGPGAEAALLGVLFAALIVNAVAGPLRDRLSRRLGENLIRKALVIRGLRAIQSGESPRMVEQKLRSCLPPILRSAQEAAA